MRDDNNDGEFGTTPTHSSKLGNKQFALYLKSQPRITTVIYNVEKYLSNYDPSYYNALLYNMKGRDLEVIQKMLHKQYSELVEGKSFIHKINKAIFSRERALQKIKRDITKVERVLTVFTKTYLKKGDNNDNVYIEYTQQHGYTTVEIDETIDSSINMIKNLLLDLSRFRDMTMYIVETIHRWRISIEEWMDQCRNHFPVHFYIRPSDYKMAGTYDIDGKKDQENERFYDIAQIDTDFLWKSKLSQYIWFQYKKDPLLIRNSIYLAQKPIEQQTILQKYFIEILYPKNDEILQKSIRTLEMLCFEYKPKGINLYAEQQKLIQNYLSLQRQNNEQLGLVNGQDDEKQIEQLQRSQIKGKQKIKLRISRLKGSQSASKLTYNKQMRTQIQIDNLKWNQGPSPYSAKQNPRGWVFGKQLKKPSTDRIRDLVKKHQVEMNYLKNHRGIIKPYNISNYGQKNSIALAYVSQNYPSKQIEYQNDRYPRTHRFPSQEHDRSPLIKKDNFLKYKKLDEEDRGIKNDGAKNMQIIGKNFESDISQSRTTRMHQSLIKLNDVIAEDPKEDQAETPKNSQNKKAAISQVLFHNTTKSHKTIGAKIKLRQKTQERQNSSQAKNSRMALQHQIKINSIFEDEDQNDEEQIKVEQEETPLNMKQFFQVFRADTNKSIKTINESRVTSHMARSNLNEKNSKGESASVHKLIDEKRMQSLRHFKKLGATSLKKNKQYKGPYATSLKKPKIGSLKKDKSLDKSRSKQKSENSFISYDKVEKKPNDKLNQSIEERQKPAREDVIAMQTKQFISLKNRQITRDMIGMYLRHLWTQLPVSSTSFTNYHTTAYQKRIQEILQDTTLHSILFDLEAEKDGKIGQAIVVESLSSKLKLRYAIQFINITKFEFLVAGIARISEQLLSTTPCQEIILKLTEDKMDPVSTHFIDIIDQVLKKKAQKFSLFHILQKKVPSLTGKSLYERVYIFESKGRNSIRDQYLKNRVIGSHRSITLTTKCLALSSNFKLRSSNLVKATIDKYKDESIGTLFVAVLQKIMTKYHLKQLKIASLSLNDGDQMVGVVRNSPFLRNLFHNLLGHMRKASKGNIPEWMKTSVTKFNSMTDLLNYLSYKEFDMTFKFDFLTQSRFILNHELTLSEIDISTSLEFIVQSSAGMLLLNNHKNFRIEEIVRNHNQNQSPTLSPTLSKSRFKVSSFTSGFLLPTTEDNYKLLVMSGKEYLQCSDSLDLYSYLQFVFKESTIQQRPNVAQIVLPDFTKRKPRINNVKMYDGLLRLFPERQFYSATFLDSSNMWENLYPSAVISLPKEDAIILDYPIIVGFYDSAFNYPITAFLLRPEKKAV